MNRGDRVNTNDGGVATVVSVYNSKRGRFVHLSNGQCNVNENELQIIKQPKPKPEGETIMLKPELEQLTKEEIHVALGAPYTPAQLKNTTKAELIQEYLKENGLIKEASPAKITVNSLVREALIDKAWNIEKLLNYLWENHKEIFLNHKSGTTIKNGAEPAIAKLSAYYGGAGNLPHVFQPTKGYKVIKLPNGNLQQVKA